MSERYRIGVDIGGTFTDLVMLDTVTGRLVNEKVLTTPADPSIGVLEGEVVKSKQYLDRDHHARLR